jgi:methyl-accepting chemotaxis protein
MFSFASKSDGPSLDKAGMMGQIAAINRSQAVIQFGLDGKILDANENFLNAVGYSIDEVRGRHHSMFVDPAYRESAEYRAFWDKLGRGEFDSGQYRRFGKSNKEIWIQASYNPVFDKSGKPVKVVKFAADITEQKRRNADFEGQIAAIHKSQAVIEFTLDGTILTANDNFLKTLGYTLEEIRGQHHRMFVEPSYRESADYRLFWERLGRGEYDAGQYKRVGKGGAEVWIQASYNPIMDSAGKPMKVVKYASNITELRTIAEQIVNSSRDKDLTQRIPLEGKAGANKLISEGFNELIASIGAVIADIKVAAREVSSASSEISSSTMDLSQRTEEQAASLEQTSASMEQISTTVKKNAENARHANDVIGSTRDTADRGGAVVSQAVAAMARIEESSRRISDIISVIDEIARQTNLLALNAAVEAARAGEAGRGFAVVASEVRSLAQRSSQAAKDIKDLIMNSSNQVQEGVQLVNRAGTSLKDIVSSIKDVAEIVADISRASDEQAGGIDQINKALVQMDEMTQQNSALVEENAASVRTLEQLASTTDERVSVFKSGDAKPQPSASQARAMPERMAAGPRPAVAAKPHAKPVSRGPARRMQVQLAAAVKKDEEWDEF